MEPFSEAIKATIDTTIAILKEYDHQKEKFFDRHIDPLYQRMVLIHKDYMAAFTQIERHVEAKTTPEEELIEFLRTRQAEFYSERGLARFIAESLGDAERRPIRSDTWYEIKRFCSCVADYFRAASEGGDITHFSALIDAAIENFASAAITGGAPRAHLELLQSIRIATRDLPDRFDAISKSYAKLERDLL